MKISFFYNTIDLYSTGIIYYICDCHDHDIIKIIHVCIDIHDVLDVSDILKFCWTSSPGSTGGSTTCPSASTSAPHTGNGATQLHTENKKINYKV